MQLSEAAYKGLMREELEYGSSVWDPQCVLQVALEHVQTELAARFVTYMYFNRDL